MLIQNLIIIVFYSQPMHIIIVVHHYIAVTLYILVYSNSERQFSYIVHVQAYLEGTKMHSATHSKGSQLVRIVVPCAQT